MHLQLQQLLRLQKFNLKCLVLHSMVWWVTNITIFFKLRTNSVVMWEIRPYFSKWLLMAALQLIMEDLYTILWALHQSHRRNYLTTTQSFTNWTHSLYHNQNYNNNFSQTPGHLKRKSGGDLELRVHHSLAFRIRRSVFQISPNGFSHSLSMTGSYAWRS